MPDGTPTLDARTVPPARRHAAIFSTFDSLATGEAFVLINDNDPKPLLYQFQAQYAGAFEWNALEAGPESSGLKYADEPAGRQR